MQPQTQHATGYRGTTDFNARLGEAFDSSIVPGIGLGALRRDLLERAKKLACSRDSGHAWSKLSPEDILHASGLVTSGSVSNHAPDTMHVTMAALLLFGEDEAIRKVLPERRIEIKAQVLDYQGYDDQATIQTNLLDSYEKLMAFVKRNLPEGKRLPELPTVCMRDAIFTEIISNLLVHRDYESQGWSRLTFQRDRIIAENPCISGRRGLLDLARIQASPKNPLLYRFFRMIHLAGEPGAGMKALARWSREYFGADVLVFDRENFKIFATSPGLPPYSFEAPSSMQPSAPSAMQARPSRPDPQGRSMPADKTGAMQDGHADSFRMQAQWAAIQGSSKRTQEGVQGLHVSAINEHASQKEPDWDRSRNQDSIKINPPQPEVTVRGETSVSRTTLHEERIRRILAFCRTPRNREEIQSHIGLNNRDYFRKEILVPLLQEGRLVATIPDKPNSPKQQYRTPGGK